MANETTAEVTPEVSTPSESQAERAQHFAKIGVVTGLALYATFSRGGDNPDIAAGIATTVGALMAPDIIKGAVHGAWEKGKESVHSVWKSTQGLRTSIRESLPIVTTRERVETAEEKVIRLQEELKQSQYETWAAVAVMQRKGIHFPEIREGVNKVSIDEIEKTYKNYHSWETGERIREEKAAQKEAQKKLNARQKDRREKRDKYKK